MAGKPWATEKRKLINIEEFEKLASYQCTQKEIAAFFNMSVDTLERTLRRDHGINLADFWLNRRFAGKIRHRKAAFENIEAGKPGWANVWLHLDRKMNPEEQPGYIPPPDTSVFSTSNEGEKIEIKSFNKFCVDAGYPEPYPKQNEMRSFAFDEDATRLLLGARKYGKTDYVTIMGLAYDVYLAFKQGRLDDTATTLIITKSATRNSAIVNEIADALEKNGVPLARRNSKIIRIEGHSGKDHNVEAITIRSSMRGRHPYRILMDDPVTEEDVSEASRKLAKTKYDEAYKLCKNICIIGQPAHAHDLYAKLRGILKKMEVPHGTIPELDDDLEAMRLAGVSPESIEMSYHLRIPVTGTTPFAKIKRIDKLPPGDSVMFIDPSDGGDHTAASAIKQYFDGVAVRGIQWKKAWYHCIPELVQFVKECGVKRICFETNATGRQPLDQLREIFKPIGIGVVGVHSDTNKHAVIMSAGQYAHMIYLSQESESTYTDHVIEYEYGAKFDDAPDSLARGLEWIGLIKGKSNGKRT